MSPRSPASLSDGEVASSEDGEKVTNNTSYRKATDVNPSGRLASSSRLAQHMNGRSHFAAESGSRDRKRSRSPFRRDRSRSRSPYRADKDAGREKRRRDEDHYGKGASDPRRHKVYEDRQSRGHSYRDPDRPTYTNTGPPYNNGRGRNRADTRESLGNPRERSRSRSPYRAPSPNQVDGSQRRGSTSSVQRESTPEVVQKEADASSRHSGVAKHASVTDVASRKRSVAIHVAPEAATDRESLSDTVEQAEPEKKLSEAELIEQRRKKREAIRKKHASSSGNDLLRATLESNLPYSTTTPYAESSQGSEHPSPPSSANSPGTPRDSTSAPASPAEFGAINEEDLANPLQVNAAVDDQEQSAADYDPSKDMNEDRPEFKRQEIQNSDDAAPAKPSAPVKKADEFDMFADDDDDMFAANEVPVAKGGSKQAQTLDESLLDNWDYPDGHYRIINGELLEGRYAVEQQVGKGTFATVVRARDTNTGNKVAIKIACRNDTMLKAGQKEMQFLERLNERDPDDKRNIIRLLGNFTHKGHLCLVFEGLHMDLRELLKKFGRDVGINLEGVKVYAFQMFQALLHMKSAEVLHADLKPDNILVNEKHTMIKICDFGTATLQQDAELTPYLVSRFYRAPEVILGMDFDYAIDMWAIGCTLYELYAGRILFNGSDNNNMLRVIQECRGKLPNRLIKRAQLAAQYFDDSFTFHGKERDKMTGNIILRPMHFAQGLAGKDLKSRLSGNLSKMTSAMLKEHHAFVDLLDKCLQLDPEKRIKPKDALHHHFFARPSQQMKPKVPAPAATFRPITVQHAG